MGSKILEKLIYSLLLMFVVFVLTEPIIRVTYFLILKNSLTYSTPIVSGAKFFALGIVLVVLAKKYMTLTAMGKRLIKPAIILLSVGLLTTTLWFTSTSESGIVKQRILHHEYDWKDVDHVKTSIATSKEVSIFGQRIEVRRTTGGSNSRRKKVIPSYEYRIVFKDGTSINAWDDTNSLYDLHSFIKEHDIEIIHGKVDIKEKNLKNYLKGDLSKIKSIWGLNDVEKDGKTNAQ